jgi:hypothetical protein
MLLGRALLGVAGALVVIPVALAMLVVLRPADLATPSLPGCTSFIRDVWRMHSLGAEPQ